MMKVYLDKSSDFKMNPNKETIQFLINFSKSLSVIKTKSNYLIELNLN
ncbi:conserved hypothetical protein [Tenacibaculum finnmarkense genomovar ulcerans]|uniref:Uncharacterized protein n=1 Tax=Tenacibaculum finnmarkense genomovar ulcerans TaxID=2781388 RepID=A0A2I2MAE2_9FLAO|nr:conserved hypothetical protein [Tenacibaculum finnmarkense genomovar ulcerans]